jgi:hypothetical protein
MNSFYSGQQVFSNKQFSIHFIWPFYDDHMSKDVLLYLPELLSIWKSKIQFCTNLHKWAKWSDQRHFWTTYNNVGIIIRNTDIESFVPLFAQRIIFFITYNKLECLSLASISSLVLCNTLAYWAHLQVPGCVFITLILHKLQMGVIKLELLSLTRFSSLL